MVKPTILIAAAAAMLLTVAVACGGASETPDTSALAVSAPTEPSAPVATVVATATPNPTNTPTAAQETTGIGGRLRIATIPPVQQLVGS